MLRNATTGDARAAAPSPIKPVSSGGGAAAPGLSRMASSRAAADRPVAAPPAGGQALRCPRCDSYNTKFCYYNNYSLSQPRYFCKACKRHWTRGGALRNVPVGGGCRKNKRIKKPSAIAAAAAIATTGAENSSPPPFPFLANTDTAMAAPSSSSDLVLLLYSLANPSSDMSRNTPIPRNPYEFHRQLVALNQSCSFPTYTGEDYQLPGPTETVAPTSLAASTPSDHLQDTCPFSLAAAFHPQHPSEHISSLPNIGGSNFLEWQPPLPGEPAPEAIPAASTSLYRNMGAAAFGAGAWPDAASFGPSVAPPI